MPPSDVHSLPLRKVFKEADISGKIAFLLSTWFGAGLFPGAPGTVGTLAALPLVFAMARLGTGAKACILLSVVGISLWSSARSSRLLQQEDPPEVVIDEAAGFLLTMFLLPLSLLSLVLGFTLFRFFDILKPFPIRRLERFKGGLGIVADDLLAALYAQGAVRVILLLIG